jgi:hypothetical protein
VNNSYWDVDTSRQPGSVGGTGKTTTQMKDPATFSGWGPDVWNIVSGNYPVLTNSLTPTTVSFTNNSNSIPNGGTAKLTWNIANASVCTASGDDSAWVGTALNATDGAHTWTTGVLSAGTYIYDVSCSGIGGVATDRAVVNVGSGLVTATAGLNCSLAMTSPITSNNEVSVNNNTIWTATPQTPCPTCTTKWSVTDANNPSPTAVTGTNPWNKIFTTVGLKTVSAQIFSDSVSSGSPCSATTTVVQSGVGTEI